MNTKSKVLIFVLIISCILNIYIFLKYQEMGRDMNTFANEQSSHYMNQIYNYSYLLDNSLNGELDEAVSLDISSENIMYTALLIDKFHKDKDATIFVDLAKYLEDLTVKINEDIYSKKEIEKINTKIKDLTNRYNEHFIKNKAINQAELIQMLEIAINDLEESIN